MLENVDLDWLAKIASILTFVITLIGAIVGIGGYTSYVREFWKKQRKLEEHLKKIKRGDRERAAKSQGGEDPRKGLRSILNLISHVGLTEDEIIQISFRSKKIERRIKKDAAGFADRLMFEYVGDDPDRREDSA